MKKQETRAWNIAFEMREEDDGPKIEGHASMFNKEYQLPGFREMVAPGAFSKTIKEADVRSLFNHDANYVIGRTKAGTLTLREDDKGLYYEATPPETTWAKDLRISMERGDIDQSSFGFSVVKEEWDTTDKNNPLRTIKEVKLYDVSPVTFPASPETDAAARSMQAALDEVSNSEPEQESHSEADDESEPDKSTRWHHRRLDLYEHTT